VSHAAHLWKDCPPECWNSLSSQPSHNISRYFFVVLYCLAACIRRSVENRASLLRLFSSFISTLAITVWASKWLVSILGCLILHHELVELNMLVSIEALTPLLSRRFCRCLCVWILLVLECYEEYLFVCKKCTNSAATSGMNSSDSWMLCGIFRRLTCRGVLGHVRCSWLELTAYEGLPVKEGPEFVP